MSRRGGCRLVLVGLLVVLVALQAVAGATPAPHAGPFAEPGASDGSNGAPNGPGPHDEQPGGPSSNGAATSEAPTTVTTGSGGPQTSDAGGDRGSGVGNGERSTTAQSPNGNQTGVGATASGQAGADATNENNGTAGDRKPGHAGNGDPGQQHKSRAGTAGSNSPSGENPGANGSPTKGTPGQAEATYGPSSASSNRAVVSVTHRRGPSQHAGEAGNEIPMGGPERGNGTPSNTAPNRSVVSISVRNAPANVPVDIDVSVASSNGAVGVEELSMSVETYRSYTLEVAANHTPFETTPSFEPVGQTTPLGFVRVNHSVPDSQIGNVSFTFRLSKTRVSHESIEQVALYRHHDGAWTELETTAVGETADAYVFRARSPGLSEFVVGKKQAAFSVSSTQIETSAVATGDRVTVRLLVTNTGDAAGTFDADLRIGDIRAGQRAVSIASGGTRQITISHTVETPGTYDVYVSGHHIGIVEVDGSTTATQQPTTRTLTSVDSDEAGLGLGIFAVLAVLFVGSSFRP